MNISKILLIPGHQRITETKGSASYNGIRHLNPPFPSQFHAVLDYQRINPKNNAIINKLPHLLFNKVD